LSAWFILHRERGIFNREKNAGQEHLLQIYSRQGAKAAKLLYELFILNLRNQRQLRYRRIREKNSISNLATLANLGALAREKFEAILNAVTLYWF